jgi:hypothetical protein
MQRDPIQRREFLKKAAAGVAGAAGVEVSRAAWSPALARAASGPASTSE